MSKEGDLAGEKKKTPLELAQTAAEDTAGLEEYSNTQHEGTLERAKETATNLRNPELQEKEFDRIRRAQQEYKTENFGLASEYLLKLAILLDLEPHELLNPKNADAVFEKLKTKFSNT